MSSVRCFAFAVLLASQPAQAQAPVPEHLEIVRAAEGGQCVFREGGRAVVVRELAAENTYVQLTWPDGTSEVGRTYPVPEGEAMQATTHSMQDLSMLGHAREWIIARGLRPIAPGEFDAFVSGPADACPWAKLSHLEAIADDEIARYLRGETIRRK